MSQFGLLTSTQKLRSQKQSIQKSPPKKTHLKIIATSRYRKNASIPYHNLQQKFWPRRHPQPKQQPKYEQKGENRDQRETIVRVFAQNGRIQVRNNQHEQMEDRQQA